MNQSKPGFLVTVLVGLTLAAKVAVAQDPAVIAPNNYKVLLENDRVRVLEIKVKPGASVPMHQHPATVIYHVGPSREKHTFGDGKVQESEFKGGEVGFSEAFSHSAQNTGTTDVHVIAVELKKQSVASIAMPADMDPAKIAPGAYKVAFENDRVRVLEIALKPGEKVPMHAHPATVIYHVGPSKEKHTFGDGTVQESEFKGGEVAYSKAFSHAAENIGTNDVHVLAIELKK